MTEFIRNDDLSITEVVCINYTNVTIIPNSDIIKELWIIGCPIEHLPELKNLEVLNACGSNLKTIDIKHKLKHFNIKNTPLDRLSVDCNPTFIKDGYYLLYNAKTREIAELLIDNGCNPYVVQNGEKINNTVKEIYNKRKK